MQKLPQNPIDGMLVETAPGTIFRYDAITNNWIELTQTNLSGDLVTETAAGMMSDDDFKKLNRLVLPPPHSTMTVAGSDIVFGIGSVALTSIDDILKISGNSRVVADAGSLTDLLESRIHQHTYGINFSLDLVQLVKQLRERGQLNYQGEVGPQGEQGARGSSGLDQLLVGPKGDRGDPGSAPACTLSVANEAFATQPKDQLNRVIVDIETYPDPLDYTKYYMVATRQQVGLPGSAANLLIVRDNQSSWVMALTHNDSVCATPQTVYYIDINTVVNSIHDKFLSEVQSLKTGFEAVVSYWLQTMAHLFQEQKDALCCALEFCQGRQANAGVQQHLDNVLAATMGKGTVSLGISPSSSPAGSPPTGSPPAGSPPTGSPPTGSPPTSISPPPPPPPPGISPSPPVSPVSPPVVLLPPPPDVNYGTGAVVAPVAGQLLVDPCVGQVVNTANAHPYFQRFFGIPYATWNAYDAARLAGAIPYVYLDNGHGKLTLARVGNSYEYTGTQIISVNVSTYADVLHIPTTVSQTVTTRPFRSQEQSASGYGRPLQAPQVMPVAVSYSLRLSDTNAYLIIQYFVLRTSYPLLLEALAGANEVFHADMADWIGTGPGFPLFSKHTIQQCDAMFDPFPNWVVSAHSFNSTSEIWEPSLYICFDNVQLPMIYDIGTNITITADFNINSFGPDNTCNSCIFRHEIEPYRYDGPDGYALLNSPYQYAYFSPWGTGLIGTFSNYGFNPPDLPAGVMISWQPTPVKAFRSDDSAPTSIQLITADYSIWLNLDADLPRYVGQLIAGMPYFHGTQITADGVDWTIIVTRTSQSMGFAPTAINDNSQLVELVNTSMSACVDLVLMCGDNNTLQLVATYPSWPDGSPAAAGAYELSYMDSAGVQHTRSVSISRAGQSNWPYIGTSVSQPINIGDCAKNSYAVKFTGYGGLLLDPIQLVGATTRPMQLTGFRGVPDAATIVQHFIGVTPGVKVVVPPAVAQKPTISFTNMNMVISTPTTIGPHTSPWGVVDSELANQFTGYADFICDPARDLYGFWDQVPTPPGAVDNTKNWSTPDSRGVLTPIWIRLQVVNDRAYMEVYYPVYKSDGFTPTGNQTYIAGTNTTKTLILTDPPAATNNNPNPLPILMARISQGGIVLVDPQNGFGDPALAVVPDVIAKRLTSASVPCTDLGNLDATFAFTSPDNKYLMPYGLAAFSVHVLGWTKSANAGPSDVLRLGTGQRVQAPRLVIADALGYTYVYPQTDGTYMGYCQSEDDLALKYIYDPIKPQLRVQVGWNCGDIDHATAASTCAGLNVLIQSLQSQIRLPAPTFTVSNITDPVSVIGEVVVEQLFGWEYPNQLDDPVDVKLYANLTDIYNSIAAVWYRWFAAPGTNNLMVPPRANNINRIQLLNLLMWYEETNGERIAGTPAGDADMLQLGLTGETSQCYAPRRTYNNLVAAALYGAYPLIPAGADTVQSEALMVVRDESLVPPVPIHDGPDGTIAPSIQSLPMVRFSPYEKLFGPVPIPPKHIYLADQYGVIEIAIGISSGLGGRKTWSGTRFLTVWAASDDTCILSQQSIPVRYDLHPDVAGRSAVDLLLTVTVPVCGDESIPSIRGMMGSGYAVAVVDQLDGNLQNLRQYTFTTRLSHDGLLAENFTPYIPYIYIPVGGQSGVAAILVTETLADASAYYESIDVPVVPPSSPELLDEPLQAPSLMDYWVEPTVPMAESVVLSESVVLPELVDLPADLPAADLPAPVDSGGVSVVVRADINNGSAHALRIELPAGAYMVELVTVAARYGEYYSAPVRLQFQDKRGRRLLAFPNRGAFTDLREAQLAYEHQTVQFTSVGTNVQVYLAGGMGVGSVVLRFVATMRAAKGLFLVAAELIELQRRWVAGELPGYECTVDGQDYILAVIQPIGEIREPAAILWPTFDGQHWALLPTEGAMALNRDPHIHMLILELIRRGEFTRRVGTVDHLPGILVPVWD